MTSRAWNTLAYFAAFIALGMIAAVLGPALPSLAAHTGADLAQMGFLFTARSFGYLLGSLYAGRAYDRLPGNRLLALMVFGSMLGLALTPLISQQWLLVAALFVMGLFEGGLDIGANLLLVWLHGARANPFLNALHFFFGLGALLSPIVVAQSLLRTQDITAAFWLLGLYPLPIALGLLRLPSPAAAHQTMARAAQPALAGAERRLVLLISLIFALYVGAEVSFGGWIYSYSLALGLGDIASAAYLTSAFWGALMVGRLVSIPISARVRPAALLLGDLLGCLASLGLILLFPGAYWAMWAGAIGLGLTMASFFPMLLAFAGGVLPNTGEITRWFFVGTGAGGMILPWLVGVLAGRLGPQTTMPVIFLDLALALGLYLVCWWLARRAHHPDLLQQPAAG